MNGKKKICLVVAFRGFKDEEYFTPKAILEQAGFEVVTASDKKGVAIGADGGETESEIELKDLHPDQFDAILFIGGPGALDHLDNEESYRVIRETVDKNKLLGAICISPSILAKAKALVGKKATVWTSPLNKSPVRILEENGAIYQNENVVVDGKVITANGPQAAQEFGQKIKEILS